MLQSIRLDIVDLDDGYKAYYVDGRLHHQSGEHAIREIIDLVSGKHVVTITYRFWDNMPEDMIDVPERYEEIVW